MALISELRPVFRKAKMTLPRKIRASCGWVAEGTPASKPGESVCHPASHSKSGHVEIFMSPRLSDSMHVAGNMVHELVHARQDDCDHGKVWQEECVKVGLRLGKPVVDTKPSKLLREELTRIIRRLGPYPHTSMRA